MIYDSNLQTAGMVAGSLLDFAGGRLAEPVLAVLFAVSVVAWAAAARAFGVRAALLGARPSGEQLSEIAKIIDSGKLALIIDRILPLSEVRRAHELSQSGHTHGKITMRVSNGDGTFERKQS